MWRIKTLPLSHRRRRRMNVYALLDRRVINLCRGISEMRSRNKKKRYFAILSKWNAQDHLLNGFVDGVIFTSSEFLLPLVKLMLIISDVHIWPIDHLACVNELNNIPLIFLNGVES